MGWCLESTADGGRSLERVPIHNLPFRIGRLDELDLTLPFQSISKRHAELHLDNDTLTLKDLASTNGTFVNRRRVEEDVALQEGDPLDADLLWARKRPGGDHSVDMGL